jgi:hypothetical protein
MVQEMVQQVKVINQKMVLDKIIIEVNHNYMLFDNVRQVFDKLQ